MGIGMRDGEVNWDGREKGMGMEKGMGIGWR